MRPLVWPPPRSLATTCGISVDVFSWPYLDVSVQAVPFVHLFDSMHDDRVLLCRVPPFGNLRINAYVPLPVAYRSLSRPSSAPDAKAFPLRSSMLDLLKIVPYFLWFSNYAGIQIGFSYEIVIVTLIFSDVVPQLKSYAFLPLCCLAFFFSLFSFQGAIEDTLPCTLKIKHCKPAPEPRGSGQKSLTLEISKSSCSPPFSLERR